jgi:hypothetical protein
MGEWSPGGWRNQGTYDTTDVGAGARRVGSAFRERAFREVDKRRQDFANRLDGLASNFEKTSGDRQGPETQFTKGAARVARKAAGVLRERSAEQMVNIAEQQVRDRPGLFLAGCAALGFVGGRVLKSAANR